MASQTENPGRVKELELVTTQGVAGKLLRESQFITRYSDEAIADPSRALALSMPSQARTYSSNRIPPVLAMNLPEGFLLGLVKARYAKVMDVNDDMNLLALTSTPTAGRVWARSNTLPASRPHAGAISLKEILSAKGTEDLFDELVEKFAQSTSLAGVMPKVAVTERGRLHSSDLIVKTGAAEYPGLAENEFLCMSIAKHAGIEVPDFYLSDDRQLFVIRRFDIGTDGKYLGFEDMASLTGRMPGQKYEGHFGNIALVIRDNVPTDERAASLERFFRQLTLCILLRNGDAHLKNWGLTYTDPSKANKDARLSPAYDIVCTTAYLPKDVLALGMQGSKAWPDRATVEQFGSQHCELTNPGKIIDELRDAVMEFSPQETSSTWKSVREIAEAGCASLGQSSIRGARKNKLRTRHAS